MKTLFLDTTDNTKTIVRLTVGKDKFEKIHDEPRHRSSQIVLQLIDEILEEAQIHISEIDHIYVDTGPGSFTGTRVGVAIANALSLSLCKKVNHKPLSEFENPVY